jgi:hypothetical protein
MVKRTEQEMLTTCILVLPFEVSVLGGWSHLLAQ